MSYIAMSVLPGPGTGVGFYEAIIGEDFLGNNLGVQERAFSGIGSILDVVTLGVAGTALRTGGKVFNYLGRSLKNSKYIKKGLEVVGPRIQKISNSVGKYFDKLPGKNLVSIWADFVMLGKQRETLICPVEK